MVWKTMDSAPPPEPARKVALVDTYDGFAHLWRCDSKGKRISEIQWPEEWPETVSEARMKEDGFKVVYHD